MVLALVGVKLLIEDVITIGPVASLAMVGVAFAIGIIAERTTVGSEPEPESDGSRSDRDGAPLRSPHPDDGERGGDHEGHEAGDQRAPAQRGQER